jgi:DegV family protein with EDD domain
MPKISIVTDSDASLSAELETRYNIRQVPITVHFGERIYKTTVDIDDAALFRLIEQEGALPTTAAPSPGMFAQAYQAAFDQDSADEVICFVVSGKVSGTHEAARIAANDLLAGRKITVVDTLSLTAGQGFMALAAAEAVAAGASAAEAIAMAEDVRARTSLFGALSTLKYLAMGGRVNQLTAGMAGMLNIKPILTIQDGRLEMLEKVRTRSKAWARTIELATAAAGDKPVERMCIVHTDARDEAREFESLLRAAMPCPDEILILPLTAGLSVHTGPGFVGVALVKGK